MAATVNSNTNKAAINKKLKEKKASALTLTDLPEECLRLILSQLPIIDKFRYETVCKLWQHVIYDLQYKLRFTKPMLSAQRSKFCGTHSHNVTSDDWIPKLMTFSSRTHQSPINMSVMNCVLQKCGQSIRCLNLDSSLINEEVFEVIAQYCPQLCCISLSSCTGITDECLFILASNYGKQLTHVNLECAANRVIYFSTNGLQQFLRLCPNISVLFLASIRSQRNYRLKGEHLNLLRNIDLLSAHLPDVETDELVKFAESSGGQRLKKLVIDGIIYNESTIHDMSLVISMFTNLRSLSLTTRCEVPIDVELIKIAKSLLDLERLYLKINEVTISTVEALSYFNNLRLLEFGLWKPFETGLLSLSLAPLKYCQQLKVLRLNNLLDTDSILRSIDEYCPNLQSINMVNMFDCSDDSLLSLSKCAKLKSLRLSGIPNIASEITEQGIKHLLLAMPQLAVLEIPITFQFTEQLLTDLFSFAKKKVNSDYISFVCGLSVNHILDDLTAGNESECDVMGKKLAEIPSNLKILKKFN